MRATTVNSPFSRRLVALIALSAGMASPCFAQPGNNSPNQFGDRQAGHWGDPGTGHFGNPAIGNFDNSVVREPAAGTRPLGKVTNGKPNDASPYISLPAPKDAAAEPVAASKAATPAKPAKKKSATKKKAAG